MEQYILEGIERDKLVLGLPWYGYDYTCLELNNNICTIKRVHFRGVNCSDAAARQIEYAEIQDLVVSRVTYSPLWDPASQSFFFNYEDSTGWKHQVWYDTVHSLTLKYELAANEGLNGVAIWNVDSLDYSESVRAQHETKLMWDALQN